MSIVASDVILQSADTGFRFRFEDAHDEAITDFFGAVEITGARDDGTALASLLTALANLGLITDSTTAS